MTRARAQLLRAASTRRWLRCPRLALLLLCIVPRLAYAAALEIGPVPGIVGSHFEYVVRKGDTLTAVSARYAVSEKALIRDNGLRAPYRLRPGDRLQVHDRHLVPGDPSTDGIVINLPRLRNRAHRRPIERSGRGDGQRAHRRAHGRLDHRLRRRGTKTERG
jgi:hypothetical protein